MNDEYMLRLYENLKKIDNFFGSNDYQNLIINYIMPNSKTTKLIEDIVLYDDTISFFSNIKEFKRCYYECCKLLNLLKNEVSEKYKPI
jgi:hypothetical protein